MKKKGRKETRTPYLCILGSTMSVEIKCGKHNLINSSNYDCPTCKTFIRTN